MFIIDNLSQTTMESLPKRPEQMTWDEVKVALWQLKESRISYEEAAKD